MNRRSVLSIMMLGLTALPNSAISQQWSIKDQLVGTWTLASWEHALPNGRKFNRMAPIQRASLFSTRRAVSFSCSRGPTFQKSRPMLQRPRPLRKPKICWPVRSRTSVRANILWI